MAAARGPRDRVSLSRTQVSSGIKEGTNGEIERAATGSSNAQETKRVYTPPRFRSQKGNAGLNLPHTAPRMDSLCQSASDDQPRARLQSIHCRIKAGLAPM